jgi:hypothetical protein
MYRRPETFLRSIHRIAEPTDANVVLTDNAGLVLTISNFDQADEVI